MKKVITNKTYDDSNVKNMVKLSYISVFGPKTRKKLKKKESKVIFTSVISLKSISCKNRLTSLSNSYTGVDQLT